MSHPVLTLDPPRRPPRFSHEEILENTEARDDHAIDVLWICKNIIQITYEGIKSWMFERSGNDLVALARSILTEPHNALGYR